MSTCNVINGSLEGDKRNLQNELFIELTNYELEHSCYRLKEKYFCEQKAVLKRRQQKTCLTSSFRQNNEEISRTCSIQISAIDEKVLQLYTTTFLIYTKAEKQVFVTSSKEDEKIEEQFAIIKLTYLTMENKCTAKLDNNIITFSLPLNFDICQKLTEIDINFKNVAEFKDDEITDFSKLLKTNLKNKENPMRITDIKKLYHIKTLYTSNESTWLLFKKMLTHVSLFF